MWPFQQGTKQLHWLFYREKMHHGSIDLSNSSTFSLLGKNIHQSRFQKVKTRLVDSRVPSENIIFKISFVPSVCLLCNQISLLISVDIRSTIPCQFKNLISSQRGNWYGPLKRMPHLLTFIATGSNIRVRPLLCQLLWRRLFRQFFFFTLSFRRARAKATIMGCVVGN